MALLPRNFKLIRVGRNFNTLSMVSNLKLSERVIALGNVNTEFLCELYRGCDIFLFPSLHEGFGIPLIEAMASGIPFITSNRNSLPEVAGDSGAVCDPYNVEFMADTILQIIQNEKLKADIVRKGLARAKTFSAENQYQSLRRVIDFFEWES
jgi:glycosyltransferase involved in cell wall biosynthesis